MSFGQGGSIQEDLVFVQTERLGLGYWPPAPVQLHIETGGKWWHYRALLPCAALPSLCIAIGIIQQWNQLEKVYHICWSQYRASAALCEARVFSSHADLHMVLSSAWEAWGWQKAETASLAVIPKQLVDSPSVHRDLSIGNLQKHVTASSRNSLFFHLSVLGAPVKV